MAVQYFTTVPDHVYYNSSNWPRRHMIVDPQDGAIILNQFREQAEGLVIYQIHKAGVHLFNIQLRFELMSDVIMWDLSHGS